MVSLRQCRDVGAGVIDPTDQYVADLDADSSSMLDPWAWLRWASGTDADDHDHGFSKLCDSCDTEASALIRDQLLLPKVARLRMLLGGGC